MTGWNLPPGCSVRDIPGNRPEDESYETFCEKLAELGLEDEYDGDREFDEIAGKLWEMMSKAYSEGYAQGKSDDAEAKRHQELSNLTRLNSPDDFKTQVFPFAINEGLNDQCMLYEVDIEAAILNARRRTIYVWSIRMMSDNE